MTLQQIINHIYTNQKTMLHRSASFQNKNNVPYKMAGLIFNSGGGIEMQDLKEKSYQLNKGTGQCFDGYLSNLSKVLQPAGIEVRITSHPNGKQYVSMEIQEIKS